MINGCKISKVYNTKICGIAIDSNVMWKYNMINICDEISVFWIYMILSH